MAPAYIPVVLRRQVRADASARCATHILGLTPTGRVTVAALRLNNDFIVVTRQFWVAGGWWPPG